MIVRSWTHAADGFRSCVPPRAWAKRVSSLLVLALSLSAALAPKAGGQEAGLSRAGAFLEPDHWIRGELARLASLGRIDATEAVWAWPLRRDAVQRVLGVAADGGGRLAEEVLRRFARESETGSWISALEVTGGWQASRGGLLTGTSFLEDVDGSSYSGPLAGADRSTGVARVRTEAGWGPLSVSVTAVTYGEARVDEAVIVGDLGPAALWLGRRRLGLGPTTRGNVVLSPVVAFDGGGVELPGGIALGPLGQLRGQFFLSRLDRSGVVGRPWFTGARLVLAPRPWLAIGLNRAAVFGGNGNSEGVSLWNLALMSAGITSYLGKDSGFENQVASVDVWMRTRVGATPLALYGEWGFDDIGRAPLNVPGIRFGVELPAIARGHAVSLGIEHGRFAGSCCGSPPWYRHRQLGDGWAVGGVPMGHELGGAGSQWDLRVGYFDEAPALSAVLRVFTRHRGEENMYAPDREGRSWGTGLAADWELRAVVVRGGVEAEVGEGGWFSRSLRVQAGWRLGGGRPD